MTDIILATRNKNKVKEIKMLLADLPVNVISLSELKREVPKIIEDGNTFEENAIKKAVTISKISKKITLADDSGLEVDSLEGKPGIYSARFAGGYATDRDNNLKLLEHLKGISEDKRTAQFKCVIAIANDKSVLKVVEGICKGHIGFSEKGINGFGYDPIFICQDYNKTFAELELKIKNKISHRAKALEKAKLVLEEILFNNK